MFNWGLLWVLSGVFNSHEFYQEVRVFSLGLLWVLSGDLSVQLGAPVGCVRRSECSTRAPVGSVRRSECSTQGSC